MRYCVLVAGLFFGLFFIFEDNGTSEIDFLNEAVMSEKTELVLVEREEKVV